MNQQANSTQKAQNLAKAIVSDINLYFEDKIKAGLQNANLFDEISNEINDGLNLYKSRVSPEIYNTMSIFETTVVDVLFYERGRQLFTF